MGVGTCGAKCGPFELRIGPGCLLLILVAGREWGEVLAWLECAPLGRYMGPELW